MVNLLDSYTITKKPHRLRAPKAASRVKRAHPFHPSYFRILLTASQQKKEAHPSRVVIQRIYRTKHMAFNMVNLPSYSCLYGLGLNVSAKSLTN
jgi:hypothetical protein